ncbi:ralBP1-associated Eps domain-containing protein 2 isoform 2-T2 [Spinachia spinachia]
MKYAAVPPRTEGRGPHSGTGPWTVDRRHPGDHEDRKEPQSPPRSPSSSPPPAPPTHLGYPRGKRRNGAEPLSASRPPGAPAPHSSPGIHRIQLARTSSSERLDLQGLVDPPDDPWRITEEQLEYYTTQFSSLQPDLGALILGTDAKNFFTKSKLPIPELSHIWELSDVDRDGALTFSEFCTAFHLIVARKNGFPLPESLPAPLRTGLAQPEEEEGEEEEEEEEQEEQDTPEGAEPLIVFEDAAARPSHPVTRELKNRLLRLTSERPDVGGESRGRGGALKYVEALMSDVRADDEYDEGALWRFVADAGVKGPRETPQDRDPHMRTRTRPRSYSSTSIEEAMKKAEGPPTPPPRPQKTHSRASSLDLNKLLQQGTAGLKALPHPPALPPRPSSSQVSPARCAPMASRSSPRLPRLPPQVSQFFAAAEKKAAQPNFADFSRFREESALQEESAIKPGEAGRPFRFSSEDPAAASKQDVEGASHNPAPKKPIRRKYHGEGQNPGATPPPAVPYATLTKATQRLQSKQKREIQTAIRKNKETNAVLTRLNSELQQQLKVVHQERVTLESKLELQRPLGST